MTEHGSVAPDQMPLIPADKDDVFKQRWRGVVLEGERYGVCLESSISDTGKGVLVVAQCPSPHYAQYIAHFHNMLLMGAELLGTSVDAVLEGYATRTVPEGAVPAAPPSSPPEETGGYL